MKEDLTTITIAGPKGGCGKSLVMTLLAMRASFERAKLQ